MRAGAGVVAGLAAALSLVALAARFAHGGTIDESLTHAWVFVESSAALVYAGVGALLVRRGGSRLIGWIFLAVASCYAVSAFAAEYGSHGLYYVPGSLPAAGAVSSLQSWIWMPANLLLATLVPMLLPHGRFRSRRWMVAGSLSVIAVLLVLPQGITNPWPWPLGPPASPLGVAHEGWQSFVRLLSGSGSLLSAALGPVAILSVTLQRRDAAPADRPALTWLLAGSVAVVVPNMFGVLDLFVETADFEGLNQLLQVVALPLLPVATLIAVLRHRLWGVETVIRRGLVGGLLVGVVAGSYAVVVAGLGWVVGGDGFLASASAAGVVALSFQPARTRIERSVSRLLEGDRRDPYAVVRSLGRIVERPAAPDDTLREMIDTLGTSLRLGGLALDKQASEGSNESDAATFADWGGTAGPADLTVTLRYHGEEVGRLRVWSAAGDPIDDRLAEALDGLAPQIASATHAASLLRDLRASRERLATAAEEERRRIHRDLHDGLGPALAGIGLAVQAADNRLVAGRTDETHELLGVLVTEVERCVNDVRVIVEGLRPPILDELGLLAAVGEHVARYQQAGLEVALVAPVAMPCLPTAVEVAAYHVVRECLTNVGRHSAARSCEVTIGGDNGHLLSIQVSDDGVGLQDGTAEGVGLRSMRDRVEATGGAFDLASSSAGTLVSASWPVRTP